MRQTARKSAVKSAGKAPAKSPSPKPARQAKSENIIRAAMELFAKYGYDDCDMECVAAKLKIAKGTLYLYFPGKQELFFACVDTAMRELQAVINAARGASPDPLKQISRAIRTYVEFFAKHPQYVELMVLERAIFRDRKQATYFSYRDRSREYWRELYAALIDAGRIHTTLSVETLLDMVGNLLYGTMFTNHFNGRRLSIAQQHRAILDFAFAGLLSPADQKKLLGSAR
jgi:AcrR family transcriptional regulator